MEASEKRKWELRLKELNDRFLAEIEKGAGWDEVKGIVEEIKEITRGLGYIPAYVVPVESYLSPGIPGEAGA